MKEEFSYLCVSFIIKTINFLIDRRSENIKNIKTLKK